MIAADYITIDGDTAWVVVDRHSKYQWSMLDRPCATCERYRQLPIDNQPTTVRCPDCDGTGRHTFNEARKRCICNGDSPPDPACPGIGPHTRTVSVVPGMVLPIMSPESCRSKAPERCIELWDRTRYGGEAWLWLTYDQPHATMIDLPSAAVPGMWAVKLNIHESRDL